MTDWDAATAEWYADKYGEYPTNRLALDEVEILPAATIVDIGCGAGAALRHAYELGARGPLIGVDPVPRMLEIARERAVEHPAVAALDFREGTAEALPVGDATADLVLAFDSFDHWSDPDAGLAEVRRILKRTGSLVVVKDGGAPGGGTKQRIEELLATAGLMVRSNRSVQQGGIEFEMWLCGFEDRSVD